MLLPAQSSRFYHPEKLRICKRRDNSRQLIYEFVLNEEAELLGVKH
jgi:hypothetical protein